MVNKKKFHGGLKVLLLLLFIMLLNTCSTCYALTSVNDINNDFLGSMIDTALNNVDYVCTSSYSTSIKTTLSNFKSNANFDTFTADFITACNSLNVDFVEQLTFVMKQNSSVITITQNNNTIGNSLPFIAFVWQIQDGNFYVYNNRYINSSKSFTTGKHFTFSPSSNGTYTLSSIYSQTSNNFNQAFRFQYNTLQNITIDNVNSVSFIPGVFGLGNQNIYLNLSNDNISNVLPYWNTNTIDFDFNPAPPEPEEPSGDVLPGTGTITNPSGEITGIIDLSGIESGITNIQNQISGDTQKVIENQNQNTQIIVNAISGETEKITNTLTDSADDLIDNTVITSGDIESALNFEIAQDPYSNFWFTLTNNLKSALLGSKRSIDISFQGRTWTISLDEYMVLPAWLIIILTPFSTAFFTWVLVRQFKLIFDKLSSGNVDSLLKENSEERYF